ncbi:Transcriptional regulator GlxA family, contains an amidase domain and an AraC-type DNA-binding HTH domain [Paraburkholderia sartisoli]|uniref:Transcriptional regulator GlxA family, contains an amidase domain and an AraC-type DNA-binding HTH domain n=2 Tax=Paraburkholderia sartisoli TaxID=83784 RepID=A0A1H4HUY9_9BURK|nr:Transcriptional regulator GlxA family, contains an amidase domain and an AraC-type DNA-binding HTH domain [Paraburkholderia sartisoli]
MLEMTYAKSSFSPSPPQDVVTTLTKLLSRTVGIVVFDDFSLAPAAQIVEIFDLANRIHGASTQNAPFYRPIFLSSSGEHVCSSAQIAVLAQPLPEGQALRSIFIAGGEGVRAAAHDTRLKAWLRRAHSGTATVWPIGNGGALLRAADLQDKHGAAVASPEPAGTSAPATIPAAVRVALDVARHDLGEAVSQRISAQLRWETQPNAAVLQASSAPVAQRIRIAARWLAENCSRRISVRDAADVAHMSDRSFLRHFRSEMGMKPSEHLRRVRLQLACALLAESGLPVDKIARRCGLHSGECFARTFRQAFHLSPTEYRDQARASRV